MWNGLAYAKREKGSVLVGFRCIGLVLSCFIMSCLILSYWGGGGDGDKKLSDWTEERGSWAAVTRGEDQDREREGFGLVIVEE